MLAFCRHCKREISGSIGLLWLLNQTQLWRATVSILRFSFLGRDSYLWALVMAAIYQAVHRRASSLFCRFHSTYVKKMR